MTYNCSLRSNDSSYKLSALAILGLVMIFIAVFSVFWAYTYVAWASIAYLAALANPALKERE